MFIIGVFFVSCAIGQLNGAVYGFLAFGIGLMVAAFIDVMTRG
jgi:hypothetical protein